MASSNSACSSCSITVVVHALEGGFASYGTFLGRATTCTLLAIVSSVLFFVGALGGGMAILTSNNDSEFLFTPVGSQANKDREVLRETFPFNVSSFGLYTIFRGDRGNAWTPEGMDLMNRLHATTLAVNTIVDGQVVRYDDVCERDSFFGCDTQIPMRCLPEWTADYTFVPNDTVPLTFPLCFEASTGSAILVPTRLGNPTLSADGQLATAAQSLRATYPLSYDRQDEAGETRASEWELAFTDSIEEWLERAEEEGTIPAGYQVVRYSSRSVNDALDASTSGDFLFISLTFVLMCVLVSALSFSVDPVRNKSILAQAGVVATGIAIPAGFGLCSYAGLPFTSIVGVAPFLLLALGIDNALILIATYLRTPARHTAEARMRETMRDAGVAITLTTTTDVLAFGLGAVSPFNSVRIFCAFTGVCLFFAYLSMIFFFAPIMVLDARREEAGLSSITCQPVGIEEASYKSAGAAATDKCKSDSPADKPEASNGQTDRGEAKDDQSLSSGDSPGKRSSEYPTMASASASYSAPVPSSVIKVPSSEDDDLNYVGASWDVAFADYLGPVVLSVPGKITVFVLWLGVLGASIYGFAQIEQGLDLQLLAPNEHYFIEAYDAEVEFYNLGVPFGVVAPNPPPGDGNFVDYAKAAVRSAIGALGTAIVEEDFYGASSDEIWIGPFHYYLEGVEAGLSAQDFDAATLNGHIAQFLSMPTISGRVSDSVSFRNPETQTVYKPGTDAELVVAAIYQGVAIEIAGTLLTVRSRPLDGSYEQADAMISLRESIDSESKRLQREAGQSINAGSIALVFEQLAFFEQFAIIVPSTLTTVFLAVAAILCVASLLLPRINAIGIVVVALASILVMLFGFMRAVGIKLNSISSINLVLAIGLSVDAVAHVTHAFLASGGVHQHNAPGSIKGQKSVAVRWHEEPMVGGQMRYERALTALKEMGRPVFQGGISSLLGLALLFAGASSYIFEVFAQLLGAVIVLGLLHAIFVLPVLLSLIGPGPVLVEEEPGEEGGKDGGAEAGGSVTCTGDVDISYEAKRDDVHAEEV